MPAYRTADATVSAHSAAAVTPSDSTTFLPTRGLYVGTGGDVAVQMADQTASVVFPDVLGGSILPIQVVKVLSTGTAVTFTGVQAGTILPIQVVKVYSTDTTATDIVALF